MQRWLDKLGCLRCLWPTDTFTLVGLSEVPLAYRYLYARGVFRARKTLRKPVFCEREKDLFKLIIQKRFKQRFTTFYMLSRSLKTGLFENLGC